MSDLTALTTPFGLLDRETQEALKAHGGPYFFANSSTGWGFVGLPPDLAPQWDRGTIYRVKPAPPKPREWWFCVNDCSGFAASIPTHVEGSAERSRQPGQSVIHVREVLE